MAVEVEKVGGDFYEVFPLGADRAVLLVGDVMGKGLAAAELTDIIRASARTVALIEPSPAFILETVDRVLRGNEWRDQSGHRPRRAARYEDRGDGDRGSRSSPGGPLRGRLPSSRASSRSSARLCRRRRTSRVPMSLGRVRALILYTDGLIEARRDDEFFGEERLLEAAGRLGGLTAQALAEALIKEASEFARGELEGRCRGTGGAADRRPRSLTGGLPISRYSDRDTLVPFPGGWLTVTSSVRASMSGRPIPRCPLDGSWPRRGRKRPG